MCLFMVILYFLLAFIKVVLFSVNRLNVPDGALTTNDREKANVLNDFFASVFEKKAMRNYPFPQQQYAEELTTIKFKLRKKYKNCLSQLKEPKSQGADKLHPHLLKRLKDCLCHPLVSINRKSHEEHKLPNIWKKANVTIFKSGSNSEACN